MMKTVNIFSKKKIVIPVLTSAFIAVILLAVGKQAHSNHDGHDHAGHNHGPNESHEGHDHSAHGKPGHTDAPGEDHSGHNHGPNESHEGHDHSAHGKPGHVDAPGEDHSGHNHGPNESHEDDDHSDSNETKVFSNIELTNMGVTIKPIQAGPYIKSEQIAAMVKAIPQNRRPIYAPWSGRVKSVDIKDGSAVPNGKELITIVRDPITRIELNLTGDILKPASEEYHELTANVSSARQELKNVEEELARLTKFDGDQALPLIPQKEIRELKYEQSNLRKSIENDLHRLRLHGYSDTNIANPRTGELWLAALKANGIWTSHSQKLYDALPDTMKLKSWAVATIGELSALGMITDQLINWIGSDLKAGADIVELGGLLQQGYTISALKALEKQNVFSQEIIITAPEGNSGWDTSNVAVRVGQYIEAGEELLTLNDNSTVYLVAEPIGSEIPLISYALQKNYPVSASPLSKFAGPSLKQLKLLKLGTDEEGRQQAIVMAENTALSMSNYNNQMFRSWGLRSGMKYNMNVPVSMIESAFTIPADAVIKSGEKNFIFVKESSETFEKRNVVILYKDSDSVVLSLQSELKSGESVVTQGAFAMNLAFLSESPAAIDPHAGHNH